MNILPRIHLLGHEDARRLTPGWHPRAWGRLKGCCCAEASKMAIVRVSTGETFLISGCRDGVSPNADYVVIDREPGVKLSGGGMGGCCGRPRTLGECPGRGSLPPGYPLADQTCSAPEQMIDPTEAAIPAGQSSSGTGMGSCPGRGSLPPGYPLANQTCSAPERMIDPTEAAIPAGQSSSGTGMGRMNHGWNVVGGNGLGGKRFVQLIPSSAKLKSLIQMDSAIDLTPQQISLVRQLLHQGVSKSDIRDILAKQELTYLRDEQQDLIATATEGVDVSPISASAMGTMLRAPISRWDNGADVVAKAYAYSLTPRQREQAESHDELRAFIRNAMDEVGLSAGEVRFFCDEIAKRGLSMERALGMCNDPWDWSGGVAGMDGLDGLLKKIGKKIKAVHKKLSQATINVVAKYGVYVAPVAAIALPGAGALVAAAAVTAAKTYKTKQEAGKLVREQKAVERSYTQEANRLNAEAAAMEKAVDDAKRAAIAKGTEAYATAVDQVMTDMSQAVSSQVKVSPSDVAPGVSQAVRQAAATEVRILVDKGMPQAEAEAIVADATAKAVQGQASGGGGVPWYVWVGGTAVALFAANAA